MLRITQGYYYYYSFVVVIIEQILLMTSSIRFRSIPSSFYYLRENRTSTGFLLSFSEGETGFSFGALISSMNSSDSRNYRAPNIVLSM